MSERTKRLFQLGIGVNFAVMSGLAFAVGNLLVMITFGLLSTLCLTYFVEAIFPKEEDSNETNQGTERQDSEDN